MRPSKLFVVACAVAVCAAAPPVAASAAPQAPTATLAGSVLPSVARSAFVGQTAPAATVRVELVLRPAHAALLAKMAARSSGRTGLHQALINRLFRPMPAARAQVAAYMHSRGFRSAGSGVLTQSFTGTAAQAEAAFGVSLGNYRLADGTAYRAPSGAIHVPATLAANVITVDGLNTLPLEHPAGLKQARAKAKATPNTAVPSGCTNSHNTQLGFPGSLQPANLAGPHAYNSAPLLAAGGDGTGEGVALVEFSNVAHTDQSTYQTCYGTTVPVTYVAVGAGNPSTSGGDEVALDQEVLEGEAPGLAGIYTYIAPGSDTMATVLDSILNHHSSEGVHIVSDSWGTCEPSEVRSDAAATNAELQLMAVAGISFYAASGDSGSSDCARFGINAPEVDDPAVQPYATGVGGTNLDPSSSHNETVWGGHGPLAGGGGGGVSTNFIKPTWQVGSDVVRAGVSSKSRCGGGKTHYCREVPDVAFDADPNTGYVIFCTASGCGGWTVFGGTSAAAPLMAAFTADANTFSLAHGGKRLGFADPFLYHEFSADHSMFHDITAGNNNINGGTTFKAQVGYDVASGLGSVDANEMAIDLAAHTRSPVVIDGTAITAGSSRNPIAPGKPTILSGKLKDRHTHTFLAHRGVIIEGFLKNGNYKAFRVHTGLHGSWALKLTTNLVPSKFQWHAVYLGEQGHAPAVSPIRNLGVS